jgi:hypothetical protein
VNVDHGHVKGTVAALERSEMRDAGDHPSEERFLLGECVSDHRHLVMIVFVTGSAIPLLLIP